MYLLKRKSHGVEFTSDLGVFDTEEGAKHYMGRCKKRHADGIYTYEIKPVAYLKGDFK